MGDYSVIVYWRTKTGEDRKVQTSASAYAKTEGQITSGGGNIYKVTRIGGGRVTPPTRTAPAIAEDKVIAERKLPPMPPPKQPEGDSPFKYLTEHADPKAAASLQKLAEVPYFSMPWMRTPWKTIHQKAVQKKGEEAWKTLTPSEKEEFGYKYTDWEKIPLTERRYHPGGMQYLTEHKEESVDEYIKSLSAQERRTLPSQKVRGIWGGTSYITPRVSESELKRLSDVSAWEHITMTGSERQLKKMGSYPEPVQLLYGIGEGAAATVVFPVTLAEMGIKFVKKDWTPPVSTRIAERMVAPRGGIGYAIAEYRPGVLFPKSAGEIAGQQRQKELIKQYPWAFAGSTVGEIVGLGVGGTAVHGARVGISRAWTTLKLPKYPLAYRPTMLLRKVYWKTRVRLGTAIEVSPESVFNPKALPGGLSYVPGGTPAARISATLKAFEKMKVDSYYVGVHASAKSWLKPIAWLHKGRETPGVSFAPYGKGSPRFLRITGDVPLSYETSGISLFPQLKFPTAPLLYFKHIKSIFVKKPGVYIAPKMFKGGGEYEVIARGFATRLGAKYFTQIEKVVVPLPEFMLRGGGRSFTGSFMSKAKDFFAVTSSYGAPSRVSLISPGYILSSALSGIKSSYTFSYQSYLPSLTSGYKSSYKKSSKTSYPSYPSVPSPPSYPSYPSTPSYSPPSYPSYPSTPSYSPPSIPSVPSYPSYYPPVYLDYGVSKKKKLDYLDMLWGKKYKFREFKVPDLNKMLRGMGF